MTNSISFYNHGTVNKNEVTIGDLTIYFSYKTPIAYTYKGDFKCRQNSWGNTTGKFLNYLCPDKKERIDGVLFDASINNLIASLGLVANPN